MFANSFFNRKFAISKSAMIERILKTKLLQMIAKYPIVTLTEPGKLGKL